MEDRTVNIILITKRFGGMENIKHHIAKYMSEECDCPIETYTDSLIYGIIKVAFFDYLRNASHTRAISCIREFIDTRMDKDVDRMIMALGMVQVAETIDGLYQYIDGWHDTTFTKMVDNGEWS